MFYLKCLLTFSIFYFNSLTTSTKMIQPNWKLYCTASLLKEFKDYHHLYCNPQFFSKLLNVLHGLCCCPICSTSNSSGFPAGSGLLPSKASILPFFLGSSSQSQIPGFCPLREPRGSSLSPSRPCSSLFCAVVSRLLLICPGEVCPIHRDSPWLTPHLACVPRMDDLKRILYSGLQHFLVPGLWVLNNLWKSSLCSV